MTTILCMLGVAALLLTQPATTLDDATLWSHYETWVADDARWPAAFGKALKPGGVVVFQTSLSTRRNVAELAAFWKDFQILRVEDLDPGMEMNDWTPSRTLPTARLVARKR